MENQIAIELETILKRLGIDCTEIGSFGSRAMGNAGPGSDWDFYALVHGVQESDLKRKIGNEVAMKLGWPSSLECQYEPDKSKCIDFKFVDRRPHTAKPLIIKKKESVKYLEDMGMGGNMVLKEQ